MKKVLKIVLILVVILLVPGVAAFQYIKSMMPNGDDGPTQRANGLASVKATPHNSGARIAQSEFSSDRLKTADNTLRIAEDFWAI